MDLGQKAETEFKLGVELAETFLARRHNPALHPGGDATYEAAMLFFFCKSYKTYQAIVQLWQAGFYEDAWLLTPTLFEIWMQAAYMRQKPEERARQFKEHDPIRQFRGFKELKKVGADALAIAFAGRPDFAEIERQFNERDKTTPWNWWGESIGSLAKTLGPPFDKEYVVGYWWQSNLIHTTVTAMQHYVTESNGEFHLNCHSGDTGPELDIKLAPRGATMMIISIIEEVSGGLSIDLTNEIQSAKKSISASKRAP